VAIATKSASSDAAEFRGQLEECLATLGRPVADILFIHGSRSDFTLDKYGRVIEELGRLKARGRIRHGGLSTHCIAACRGALAVPEIEVVMPIANLAGMGIADGPLDEMLDAMARLRAAGRGLLLMKALAGGALIARRAEALRWARERSGCHAVVVGMVSEAEASYNLALFGGEPVPADGDPRIALAAKRLIILRRICRRCGACVATCPSGAMKLGPECAEPDAAKCVLCGYCIPGCKRFSIRMV
jgi:aryl-alcohol dehydrogenase-like predicted oxidoreductase